MIKIHVERLKNWPRRMDTIGKIIYQYRLRAVEQNVNLMNLLILIITYEI